MSDEISVTTSELDDLDTESPISGLEDSQTVTSEVMPEPEEKATTAEKAPEKDKPAAEKEEKPANDQESDPDKDEGKETPKPDKVQKRISELTFHRRQAERERDTARQQAQEQKTRLDELQAKLDELSKPPDKDPGEEKKGKPAEGDFENYEDYIAELARWEAEKLIVTYREEEAQKKEADAAEKKAAREAKRVEDNLLKEEREKEELKDRLVEGGEKYEDFQDVVFSEEVVITEDMAKALGSTDNPADIAYYLATHRDESIKIAQSSNAVEMAIAIGKIDAVFSKTEQQPNKKTSQAPEPIKPTRSNGVNTGKKKLEDLDHEAYRKARMEGRT